MFHVERWQKMFHMEQRGDLLKRFKLKFLYFLTKIIWWFRKKVVSLHHKFKLNVLNIQSYDKD